MRISTKVRKRFNNLEGEKMKSNEYFDYTNMRQFTLLQIANLMDIAVTFFVVMVNINNLWYERNAWFIVSYLEFQNNNIWPLVLLIWIKLLSGILLGILMLFKVKFTPLKMTILFIASMIFVQWMVAAFEWITLFLIGFDELQNVQYLQIILIPLFLLLFLYNYQFKEYNDKQINGIYPDKIEDLAVLIGDTLDDKMGKNWTTEVKVGISNLNGKPRKYVNIKLRPKVTPEEFFNPENQERLEKEGVTYEEVMEDNAS